MSYHVDLPEARQWFAEYSPVAHLNREGVKDVFKGELDGEPIAVKTFDVGEGEAGEIARQEATRLRDIDAPGFVDIREAFCREIPNTRLFVLVEEFVPGETLRERLDREGATKTLATEAGATLLSVIAALSEHGTSHRDIKPQHLRITPDDEMRVVDAGIVRLLSATGHIPADQETVSGTLAYSAPEQLETPEETDSRTDLFSAGVVLFETLTGRHPFDVSGRTITDAIEANDRHSFDDVTERPNQELVDVVDRLLAHEPEERFQNPQRAVKAFRDAIDEDVRY